jgi:hypothetical protein
VLHQHFNDPPSISSLTTALLASAILACSLVDDEPPVGDAGETGSAEDVCLEQLEAAQAQCQPGMNFEAIDRGRRRLDHPHR